MLWQKTNRNVVYPGLYSYRQRVRVITLFSNIFSYCFCMLSGEFAKVFERKVWRVQVAHLHNAERALSLSTSLAKISVVIVVEKEIECRLAWHWWNSTYLGLSDMFLCRNCLLYIIIQKIAPQAEYGTFFQIWFFPRFGRKKWRRSEHAHASYPGLSLRPPGFSPYMGQGEFRDWTRKSF